jgi:hypothetical protein
MKIKIVIGVIVAVLLLIAGNWFYASQEAYAPFLEDSNEPGEASAGKTFAQLMGMGQSLECTYEYNDGANVSSGTMYMADGGERLRGEFTVAQSGAGPMQMYMVRADGYNYMWGSAMPQGIKTKVTEENKGQLFDAADAQAQAINNTQYKCSAWREDSRKFAVPTDVQFMDMGDLSKMMGAPKIGEATMKTEGTVPTDIKAMQCAACDQAGPARDQCRQALGC